ncbi:hydroxyacylglutathione hydrolase [Thalassotalea insulae]|uniref:Hydroxyacylglutathione hydrolase n=1 Tax=Thalassotalea insulae TaxID=2056778 RepID=A0ABQ6GLD5_9GAMM|nr:hydroxyacylglutathione hydrolase [Thalassotalea insulae]GLX76752.1 hydroxyacylglutathione hydrolase [Thalassotalea insulae]
MSQSQTLNHVNISPIKAFSDNYIWAITKSESHHLALIDPGDAKVCIDHIEQQQLVLSHILITHHHPDHTGGISELVRYCHNKQWPIEVLAPKSNVIPDVTRQLKEKDKIELTDFDVTLTVIELPGHTLDHIGYYNNELLFCGDTLFSGGCGRLFEGSPEQMHTSLNKLKQLPEQTAVYCTHEYTLANLEFALAVEPKNPKLVHYYHQVAELRRQDKVSLPSSIALEKQINPFLRADQTSIKESAQQYLAHALHDEVAVFATIRKWKDSF